MKIGVCIFWGMAALAAGAAEGGVARVSVDAANPQWTISKYLTGMHFVYAFERDSLYADERIADWMRRARVGIIRWPGGTAVQNYHWDALNGIAFLEDSWDPAYSAAPAPPGDYMDLDEYIAFCRKIGCDPMVGVNIRSGKEYDRKEDSLDEARRLIRHCVDNGYNVKHWYIGNECYKGWNANSYADYIDLYAEVLKSVDPEITIIGDWKFGPEAKNNFEGTLAIARRSKHIDVMEVHEKWGNQWGLAATGGKTLADWQAEPGIYGGKLARYIEAYFADQKAAGKNVRLGFNEWGAEIAGDGATPFHVALVKADYLIEMFRHPIYSACDWNLNMGPGKSKILITSNDGRELAGLSPAAHVFEMCGQAQEGRALPMASSDPVVYGFAAAGPEEGVIQVYLLNKRSDAVEVELAIAGAAPGGAGLEMETFSAPGELTKTILASPAAGGEALSLRLEPLSFNRLVLRQATQTP